MNEVQSLVRDQPFFAELTDAQRQRTAEYARLEQYPAGRYLIRQNGTADRFMILLDGHVLLKAVVPRRGVVPLETLGAHDPLGWSWLAQPRKWHYDARAVEDTTVLAFDADALLADMERDHELGYHLQRRMIDVIAHRLQAARLQSLDLYANPGGGG